MILLLGGEKGGTGKTTIATNLAALRAAAGYDVLLIDTDRQGTAAAWCQVRAEDPRLPRIACVQLFGKNVQTGLRDLAGRYREVIIDAGGRDAVELRSALVGADCVYIPIQPSQYDVWTLEHMQELVVTAHEMALNELRDHGYPYATATTADGWACPSRNIGWLLMVIQLSASSGL